LVDRNVVRQIVWKELKKVAKPDSRFHLNFAEYITDFIGSEEATHRLTEMDIYKNARVVFVTPDNCLETLRAQVIRDEKLLLMTTYGIRRGFIELRRQDVPEGLEDYAVLLDVIERMGRYRSLSEIQQLYQIDLMVTGGSAVTLDGTRFGKGHGYFDIEWAMLYMIKVVDTSVPIVDVVHDCQIVDIELEPASFDTVCDYIVTPTRVLHVENPQKPVCGILWDILSPGMMEDISPLSELKHMEDTGILCKIGMVQQCTDSD